MDGKDRVCSTSIVVLHQEPFLPTTYVHGNKACFCGRNKIQTFQISAQYLMAPGICEFVTS